MAQRPQLIFLGAEAEVTRSSVLGIPSVRKRRLAKSYRHPDLDRRIRRERTKLEALVLSEAQAAGVAVPRVLDVDLDNTTLELEEIDGLTLRETLERDRDPAAACREFGAVVGRLHAAGLVHGDLTTSNAIVGPKGLVLVDFGLAQRSSDLEDRGVDMHLVERTFASAHAALPGLFDAFLQGYRTVIVDAGAVEARTKEIEARGRYA